VVEVTLDRRTAGDVTLRFLVRDTGIGIAHDKQWKIFGAFEQADASTTRRHGGTGLGLTISAQLVELMEGRLWLDSEPGEGSRFHFVAQFGVLPETAEAMAPPAAALRELRTLVVDDNATNRLILSEILAGWQLKATVVDGAAAALERLQEAARRGEPFELVLTDALMPGVDGFALAEKIARDARLRSAKVILLTSAASMMSDRRSAALFAARLAKPIKQSDLLDAIVNAFAGPAPAVSPAAPATAASRPLRVLVAEDNPTNQKLIETLLRQRGHQVTMVADGRGAVDRAADGSFDVILMDVQMPEMSGLEATAEIRGRERASGGHVPIVALTASAMAGDREECLACGMDGYISKPLRPDELFATIDSLCAPPGEAAGAAVDAPAAPAPVRSVDLDQLLAGFNGNTRLVRDVVDVFLQDAPETLARIRDAARARDARALGAAAHTLKGSAGLFAQGRAYESARRLEQVARAGDLAGADAACAAVEADVSRLMAELRDLRASLEQ
jgi:two-component system sensor histidine kinase/response regulator